MRGPKRATIPTWCGAKRARSHSPPPRPPLFGPPKLGRTSLKNEGATLPTRPSASTSAGGSRDAPIYVHDSSPEPSDSRDVRRADTRNVRPRLFGSYSPLEQAVSTPPVKKVPKQAAPRRNVRPRLSGGYSPPEQAVSTPQVEQASKPQGQAASIPPIEEAPKHQLKNDATAEGKQSEPAGTATAATTSALVPSAPPKTTGTPSLCGDPTGAATVPVPDKAAKAAPPASGVPIPSNSKADPAGSAPTRIASVAVPGKAAKAAPLVSAATSRATNPAGSVPTGIASVAVQDKAVKAAPGSGVVKSGNSKAGQASGSGSSNVQRADLGGTSTRPVLSDAHPAGPSGSASTSRPVTHAVNSSSPASTRAVSSSTPVSALNITASGTNDVAGAAAGSGSSSSGRTGLEEDAEASIWRKKNLELEARNLELEAKNLELEGMNLELEEELEDRNREIMYGLGALMARLTASEAQLKASDARIAAFNTLWTKISPRYTVNQALADSQRTKGRVLHQRMLPKAKEGRKCDKQTCKCIAARHERIKEHKRVKDCVKAAPCGDCDCCRDSMGAHIETRLMALSIPPLPNVEDNPALKAAFKRARTHPSGASTPGESYKAQEHLGDGMLELTIRNMIGDTLGLSGRAARRLGTWCVRNSTLAVLAKYWGLNRTIVMAANVRTKVNKTKLRADVVEAHFGAMFKEMGWDWTDGYLRQVFKPIITFLAAEMKAERLT
ncbi:hypothetical protein Q8F55_004541 [Vanrija albida]|uniref:RNase III domain-containing protein n=1 Tax=Vanrija albida TaxID=181172 RepID=A0ABR3Q707_9TREE